MSIIQMVALLTMILSSSQVFSESKYRFNEETAEKYLNREYNLPSFEKTEKDARNGDVFAQSRLGDMHNSGEGVRQDTEKAIYWYRKAMEGGDNRAPFVLAGMYEFGNSFIQQDYKQAVMLYRVSAERNYIPAQHNLGIALSIGHGTPKDHNESVKWLRKAAEQGHAESQNSLAYAYVLGHGVPKDYITAYAWWNVAAAQGIEGAESPRNDLEEEMTNSQIEAAQKLSKEYFEKYIE